MLVDTILYSTTKKGGYVGYICVMNLLIENISLKLNLGFFVLSDPDEVISNPAESVNYDVKVFDD
jgi:hypothetical protein